MAAEHSHDSLATLCLCLLCFLSTLLVYSSTRYRGIPGGDAGELMAMACAGGVAHPPGYPLLTMMGRAWLSLLSRLDILPSAKLSLLSCFLGAAGVSLQFAVALSVTEDVMGSLLAAGMLAFSDVSWKFCTQFEVFSLNIVFSSCILLLTSSYLRHGQLSTTLLGSFVCGLALTNQHTILILVFTSVLFVFHKDRSALLRPKRMMVLFVLFAMGMTPYCYLLLAGSEPPMGSWGMFQDVRGVVRHLLREEYGTFQLYTSGRAETPHNTTTFEMLEKRWKRNFSDFWNTLMHETEGTGAEEEDDDDDSGGGGGGGDDDDDDDDDDD
eukprot:768701-Hanusia_phi.AAC.1